MPFTPFHMGPGMAVKAIGRRHFSLMVFGFNQVAMDIEPLVRIIRRDAVLHGFTHTYLGATLIAMTSILIGRPVCQYVLNTLIGEDDDVRLSRHREISWPAAVIAGFVGSYSHVFLDSLMHADMHPFSPFSQSNGLLHAIPVGTLHVACVVSGVVGLVVWGVLEWKK